MIVDFEGRRGIKSLKMTEYIDGRVEIKFVAVMSNQEEFEYHIECDRAQVFVRPNETNQQGGDAAEDRMRS